MASRLGRVRGRRRRRHFVPRGARRLCVDGGARQPGAISFPGEGARRQRRWGTPRVPQRLGRGEGSAGGRAAPRGGCPWRYGRPPAVATERRGRRRRAPAGRDSWLGRGLPAGSGPAVAVPTDGPGAFLLGSGRRRPRGGGRAGEPAVRGAPSLGGAGGHWKGAGARCPGRGAARGRAGEGGEGPLGVPFASLPARYLVLLFSPAVEDKDAVLKAVLENIYPHVIFRY